jgi:hypothetical protein
MKTQKSILAESDNLSNGIEALILWTYLVQDSNLGEEIEIELKPCFFQWFQQKLRLWSAQRGFSKSHAISKLIKLWLAYIQPWKVSFYSKACISSWAIQYFQDSNPEHFSKESVIGCDYPFYTVLFYIILTGYVENSTLFSEDLQDLNEILECFQEEDLLQTIHDVETSFLQNAGTSDCNDLLYFEVSSNN